jgi:hypothetical protein
MSPSTSRPSVSGAEAAVHGPLGSRRARRALLVLGGAAAFLGIASVVKPPPQSASASPSVTVAHAERRPAPSGKLREEGAAPAAQFPDHPQGWKLIGLFRGRQHEVRAYASPEGPRYGVYGLDGTLLQADLPSDEVYRAFPDIDLNNLQGVPEEGSGALMLAPTE